MAYNNVDYGDDDCTNAVDYIACNGWLIDRLTNLSATNRVTNNYNLNANRKLTQPRMYGIQLLQLTHLTTAVFSQKNLLIVIFDVVQFNAIVTTKYTIDPTFKHNFKHNFHAVF